MTGGLGTVGGGGGTAFGSGTWDGEPGVLSKPDDTLVPDAGGSADPWAPAS